jgi:uncharacterized protein YcaQ
VESVNLSVQEARRIAIRAQRLAGPRPPATAEGLMEIARSIRVIQIDSIAVAGAPTQYLVPFSRLGPYDRAILDRLVFVDRRLFHYLAHAASLVLTEDFPIFATTMRPYAKRTDKWAFRAAEWMEANAHLRHQVLNAIRQRGPLRSRDLEDTATEHWQSTGWTAGRNVNQMLERLWVEGEITVVGRDGNQRLWDLAKRWFPAWTPRERLSATARSDRAVELSLRALGVATERQVYGHFTRGAYDDLKGSLQRLVDRGEAIPATVAGRRGFYLHRERVEHQAPWRGRTVLLSPFDNLIADRARTKMLFDFDFGIEIYVPAAKRKRGYYVLPILSGDRLVGSADVRFDRDTRRLIVQKLLFEEGFGMTAAVQCAIDELETFVSANGGGSPEKRGRRLASQRAASSSIRVR